MDYNFGKLHFQRDGNSEGLMDTGKALFAIGMFLLVLSFIPLLPDPYDHMVNVDFWAWLDRELTEVWSGER